jgi:hypothetical protein
MKTVLCLHHRQLVPTAHFTKLSPKIRYHFSGQTLTFLSFKLTFLSLKLTFLSFKLTFLSLKLSPKIRCR